MQCYLFWFEVASPVEGSNAACEADQECHRRSANSIKGHRSLGYRMSRLRRQGYAEGTQDIHRIVSNSRSRVATAQIYHRTLRSGDPQSSSRDGSKGVRRETRWTRSRRGEKRLPPKDGG